MLRDSMFNRATPSIDGRQRFLVGRRSKRDGSLEQKPTRRDTPSKKHSPPMLNPRMMIEPSSLHQ